MSVITSEDVRLIFGPVEDVVVARILGINPDTRGGCRCLLVAEQQRSPDERRVAPRVRQGCRNRYTGNSGR